MSQVLAEYPDVVVDEDGVRYRAHACGVERPGGRWEGWLEFLPLDGGPAIRSERETTQPNRKDTVYWATGLTPVYLEGSLQRALNPRVIRIPTVGKPLFDGPARTARAETASIPTREAILNPFSVFEKGELILRRQLGALAPPHLVNIIKAYRLSEEPPGALNRLPEADLIETIVSGVAADRARR